MSESHWCQCANCTAERVREGQRIAELEAERRWIPVSERLPDTCKDYLCLRGGSPEICDWWDGWLDARGRPVYDVTHWMPLPAPPE